MIDLPAGHRLKLKLYHWMILLMTLATVSFCLLVWTVNNSITGIDNKGNNEYSSITNGFELSYIFANMINPTCFMLAIALMARIAKPVLRGILFSFMGIFGSVMIVV